MYDFDWDGEQEDGDENDGQVLFQASEPTADPVGIDTPGALAPTSDWANFGVYNGNFRIGPPDPSAALDETTSTSGSNFVPGWRFVRSSNSNIAGWHTRNASAPSGSNISFQFSSGAAGDEAYYEQIIDVGGSRRQWVADLVRSVAEAGTGNTGTFTFEQRLQYLDTDGSIVGMPGEQSVSGTVAAGGLRILTDTPDTASQRPPGNTRFLRVRLIAKRGGAANSATGTVAVTDVRRDRTTARIRLLDDTSPQTYGPADIYQSDGDLVVYPQGVGSTSGAGVLKVTGRLAMLSLAGHPSAPPSGYYQIFPVGTGTDADEAYYETSAGAERLLTRQLVPIHFVAVNVPASATTIMELSDNAAGAGNGRTEIPWAGSIVGVSYRTSTSLSAGQLSIRPTVASTEVWTAFDLTSSSAAADSATQGVGTDDFSAGQNVGINLVANGSFAPTTLDVTCVLWIAVKYDGT